MKRAIIASNPIETRLQTIWQLNRKR